MAELCRFYEIARGTGYKWVGRFEAGGIDALRICREHRTCTRMQFRRR
jgi:transposase